MDNTSILDPTVHARIIANAPAYCELAGVQRRFLDKSMKGFCEDAEVDWVRNFKEHEKNGVPGLMLHGVSTPDTRCQAIAAALMRNFTDARVIPLNTVLELHEEGDMPVPHVLLIPNLYIPLVGKNLPAWKVQIAYDLLLNRAVQNKPTVVYVEHLMTLKKHYGSAMADFLAGFIEVRPIS